MFFNNPIANFAQPLITQAGYAKNIVTDGLILYLDASIAASNPGSGTTWFDLSPSGYNFTLYNGAAFGGSGATAYVEFDGTNDYTQNGSSVLAQIGALPENTVQMTVNPDSTSEEDLWSTNDIGGQGSFLLMLLNGNTVRNHLWTNGGVAVPDNTNGGSISGNFQLGGGWSWTNGLCYSYRAGQTTVSVSLPGSQPTSAYTATNLGTRLDSGGGSSYFYDGKMYNIVVYNRLLSDTERGQNFTALAV
jgi:hypothetical protein